MFLNLILRLYMELSNYSLVIYVFNDLGILFTVVALK